jgi:hypothetical protein
MPTARLRCGPLDEQAAALGKRLVTLPITDIFTLLFDFTLAAVPLPWMRSLLRVLRDRRCPFSGHGPTTSIGDQWHIQSAAFEVGLIPAPLLTAHTHRQGTYLRHFRCYAAKQVRRFVLWRARQLKPTGIRALVVNLRSLLRFLEF